MNNMRGKEISHPNGWQEISRFWFCILAIEFQVTPVEISFMNKETLNSLLFCLL